MAFKESTCLNCGKEFKYRYVPSQPNRGKYCSLKCFHIANTKYPQVDVDCPVCGKAFKINRLQARALATGEQALVFCSMECSRKAIPIKHTGAGNPNWKGGRIVSNGYAYRRVKRLKVSPYVLEHRLIAEQKLGRQLEPGEIVHHINGDTSDNRPENLDIMPSISSHMKEHARRRSEAKEIARCQ